MFRVLGKLTDLPPLTGKIKSMSTQDSAITFRGSPERTHKASEFEQLGLMPTQANRVLGSMPGTLPTLSYTIS